VVNHGRAWRAAKGEPVRELAGKELAQTRLEHPAVFLGDWRSYYDMVRVLRGTEVEGHKVYVVQLESAGLPSATLNVDAETGDVHQYYRTLIVPGAGALPVTPTYGDYRVVCGIRVPYRYVETNEPSGHTIYQVERVDAGVVLDPRASTVQR
jgi:hypothetical protein